jgi:hypothetical protein
MNPDKNSPAINRSADRPLNTEAQAWETADGLIAKSRADSDTILNQSNVADIASARARRLVRSMIRRRSLS